MLSDLQKKLSLPIFFCCGMNGELRQANTEIELVSVGWFLNTTFSFQSL